MAVGEFDEDDAFSEMLSRLLLTGETVGSDDDSDSGEVREDEIVDEGTVEGGIGVTEEELEAVVEVDGVGNGTGDEGNRLRMAELRRSCMRLSSSSAGVSHSSAS